MNDYDYIQMGLDSVPLGDVKIAIVDGTTNVLNAQKNYGINAYANSLTIDGVTTTGADGDGSGSFTVNTTASTTAPNMGIQVMSNDTTSGNLAINSCVLNVNAAEGTKSSSVGLNINGSVTLGLADKPSNKQNPVVNITSGNAANDSVGIYAINGSFIGYDETLTVTTGDVTATTQVSHSIAITVGESITFGTSGATMQNVYASLSAGKTNGTSRIKGQSFGLCAQTGISINSGNVYAAATQSDVAAYSEAYALYCSGGSGINIEGYTTEAGSKFNIDNAASEFTIGDTVIQQSDFSQPVSITENDVVLKLLKGKYLSGPGWS